MRIKNGENASNDACRDCIGTVTNGADGKIVLGTDATMNASPDSFSKFSAEQQDNIKKTCAGKDLGDRIMKDCQGFGIIQ